MIACSSCGAENRDQAKFCQGCGTRLVAVGEPAAGALPSTEMAEEPAPEVAAVDLATVILPTEIQVGNLPPGTVLQERYEIVGVVARQADRATYRAYDRKRCWACGEASGDVKRPDSEEPPVCLKCGADLSRLATSLRSM